MRVRALRDTLENSGDATASAIDLNGGFLLRPKKVLNDCSPSPGPVARFASSSLSFGITIGSIISAPALLRSPTALPNTSSTLTKKVHSPPPAGGPGAAAR